MKIKLFRAFFTTSVFITPGVAKSHNFWIEPSAFEPVADRLTTFRIFAGEHYEGEEFVRHPLNFVKFDLFDLQKDSEPVPISGQMGMRPAGFHRFKSPGAFIAYYESGFVTIKLPHEKFKTYLQEEDLSRLVKLTTPPQEDVKERFSRFSKALLVSQGVSPKHVDRQIGARIELVCECSTLELRKRPLNLLWHLFYRGKSLSDAPVMLLRKEGNQVVEKRRTDKDGKVSFTVDHPGQYLVKAVQMEKSTIPEVEWQSFWASTAFYIQP